MKSSDLNISALHTILLLKDYMFCIVILIIKGYSNSISAGNQNIRSS